MGAFLLLAIAVISEVFGSTMLKVSDGFKRILPTIAFVAGYGIAFYTLSVTLQYMPLGMAYAIWSGLGTALTAVIGIIIFKEGLNSKKLWGLVLIVAGVVILNI